jgi:hypothetical protein
MDVWGIRNAPTGINLLSLFSPQWLTPDFNSQSLPTWHFTQQYPCLYISAPTRPSHQVYLYKEV